MLSKIFQTDVIEKLPQSSLHLTIKEQNLRLFSKSKHIEIHEIGQTIANVNGSIEY